jgi:hypothetical protein
MQAQVRMLLERRLARMRKNAHASPQRPAAGVVLDIVNQLALAASEKDLKCNYHD